MDPLPAAGAARALLLVRALRAAILAVCLAAGTAAWLVGSSLGLGLALVIAVEETWETTVVVAALRRQLGGAPVPRAPRMSF